MTTPVNPVLIIPSSISQGTRLLRSALALCRIDQNPNVDFLRSAEERELFGNFKTPKRRQEFVAGRLAAYHAIEQLIPPGNPVPAIVPGAMGQPTLLRAKTEAPELSISHTFPWAVALASEPGFPVAVDMERADGSRQSSLAEILTEAEKSLFPQHAVAFSAKEALAKFLRCGFNASWQVFEISGCKKEETRLEIGFEHFSEIRVLSYQIGSFVLSLAAPSSLHAEIDLELLAKTFENQ